jgi:cold shock CspA family protein
MHEVIDNRLQRNDPVVNNIFVPNSSDSRRQEHPAFDKAPGKPDGPPEPAKTKEVVFEQPMEGDIGDIMISTVLSLKNGYGFIKYPPNNLFFHYTTVDNVDFNDLLIEDQVEFKLAHNTEGQLVATDVNLIEEDVIEEDADEQE